MLCWISRAVALVTIVMAMSLPVHPADATLMQVGSRSALGANLDINWGIFGPAGTVLSCFCSAPTGGLTVSVNSSSGTVDRFDEGVDYTGNFARGDALVSQPFISDVMTVGFISSPVSAAGTQIQPLGFVGPFTGTLRVLTNDGMDASFSVPGVSTTAEDNSAPFLGVVSTTSDIIGLRFFADIGNPTFPAAGNIAINQLDVRLASVSEPGSAPLLGAAALALLLWIGLVGSNRSPPSRGCGASCTVS